MEGKKSFVLYANYIDLLDGYYEDDQYIEGMTDEEAGKWIKTIFRYVNDMNPEIPREIKQAFILVRKDLKADLVKYNAKVESIKKAREIKLNTNNTNRNQVDINMKSSSNQVENNSVNVNVNDNVNVNVNNNNVIKNNNMCVSSAENQLTNDTKQDEIDVMFEEFWKEYPRKIDKKGCLTKFKHIKKLKENYSKIMSALKIQKQSRQWQDIQYIPHPKTWLNQERWNNEEIQNPNPKDKWDGYKFNEI